MIDHQGWHLASWIRSSIYNFEPYLEIRYLVTVPAILAHLSYGRSEHSLRVMTYNILNGGQDNHEHERFGRILSLIAEQCPHVLVLQEAMYFDQQGGKLLHEAERSLGLRGFLANASSGQHVAIFVHPALLVYSYEIDSLHFHHALARLRLLLPDGEHFTVLGAHLCPHGSLNRLSEVQRIVNYARQGEKVVLAGDLNNLDHYRDHSLTIASLPDHYRARHLLPGKSLEVDTRVTKTIEAVGFIDIARKFHSDDLPTAPTSLNTAGAEFDNMRVDYIYATPPLAELATGCTVVRSDETNSASDHYPVVADFDITLTS